ncbi:BMC domain-containing protein [Sporosarcina sp. 179-K 3D1 HS]
MNKEALDIVEARGLVNAIELAGAMVKTVNTTLVVYQKLGPA